MVELASIKDYDLLLQIFSIAFYNFQCYTSYKVLWYLIGSITFVPLGFVNSRLLIGLLEW
ncbi:hypothetical protein B0H49_003704 [Clostridium beijerinckii]|jgi:hypothetical protein|uniref:Uncharacterized protein n=1 Tax=Clostridium diolis TaxID=223919 RepID=A0AAV3VZF9_9CLOT|nr:hypothetical protein [Clostridium beijerinckii]GEA30562.1 hypothetical protein CDIOL_14850 [Clostridium diolis]